MNFNFITNINGCIESATQMMNGNLSLVYYSHIPIAIISLLIGFFVIRNNRSAISARVLFLMSMTFVLWVVCNLIAWVSSNSLSIMFVWSLFGIIDFLLFSSCLYLIYTYELNKDLPLWLKIMIGLLFLPIIITTPLPINITNFDYSYCYAENGNLFNNYSYFTYAIIIITSLIVTIVRNIKIKREKRKEFFLFASGAFLFMISILATYYISNVFEIYSIEVYGIFVMTFFMAFLAYLIVKFKAFDIKLIGAQALVWALVIFVGSEFFFVKDLTAQLLVGITLVISSVLGLILVRSVKKEVSLRESLEVANQNQQSLIHFISHQLKGFFTKSKMIFGGLIEGDFGEVSEVIKDTAKIGLDSDNNAVAMIQDILGASNLKTGVTNYNFKKVDLTEIVKKIIPFFEGEAQSKGLKFERDISAEPLLAMADETQITQVFKNLIDNSIKYTPTGEMKVSIKTRAGEKNKILFAIRDTGIGLSDKDKAKLFTEGGKGDEALKTNVNSTGYGLYIVKKIVETHHGKIWAESAGRGHGSQFYVEIPSI